MLIEEVEGKIKEVIEKDFKGTMIAGYNKQSVDTFLDELVEFYEHIIRRLKESENDGDHLVKENLKLKNQIIKLEQQIAEVSRSKDFDMIMLKQQLTDMSKEIEKLKK